MTPKFEYIKVGIEKGIATIMLNRPEKRNAMSSGVLREIDAALDYILKEHGNKENPSRVVLFCGAGDHFTGGADIKEMITLDATKAYEFSGLGHSIADKFEHYPLPVIAIIQGFCMGGGVELVSGCDIRIAAKDATFGQPEIDIGIVTGWGSSQRLPRLVGISKAKELMYTGRRISGEEACRLGLVDYAVDRAELEQTAKKLANEIIAKSASAVAAAKATVYKAFTQPLSEGIEFERKSFAALFGTRDQKEAMTAFLEKRKPEFKDGIEVYFNKLREMKPDMGK